MGSTPICTIDAGGIHRPSLATCIAYFTDSYATIYGADVYQQADSEDGQLLGLLGAAVDDGNSMAVAVYNSFSPTTAQGVGLSTVVSINGIARAVPSNSTVPVLIVGVGTTTITAGAFSDPAGNVWTLPPIVTIPSPVSQITVTATCQTLGAVTLAAGLTSGALTGGLTILNPTLGWQTVTTQQAATPGAPVETDTHLRARQARSTQIPSSTMLDGIVGAVLALPGVQTCKAYENDTSLPDANGAPGYTIYLVVQGGDAQQIANTIAAQKFACGTWGTTSRTVVDATGVSHVINFFYATVVQISYIVTVVPGPNYSTNTNSLIQQSLAQWTNLLGTGADVQITRAYNAAYLAPIIATAAAALQEAVATGDQGSIASALAQFNLVNSASTTYEILDSGLWADRPGGAGAAAADVAIAFNEVAHVNVDSNGNPVNPTQITIAIAPAS